MDSFLQFTGLNWTKKEEQGLELQELKLENKKEQQQKLSSNVKRPIYPARRPETPKNICSSSVDDRNKITSQEYSLYSKKAAIGFYEYPGSGQKEKPIRKFVA